MPPARKKKAKKSKAKNRKKKPTKKVTKRKKLVKRKKVTKKKPARKAKKVAKKKKPARAAKKVVKKKPAKSTKKQAREMAAKVMGELLGKVIHYYDRIGVAIVEIEKPIRVGGWVTIRRGEKEFTQAVSSLQIDHAAVASANRGQVVGLKVAKETQEGAEVYEA